MTQQTSTAADVITAQELMQHIKTLASDEFQGRLPASEGEQKTLDYFDSAYRALERETGRKFEITRQKVPTRKVLSKPHVSFTTDDNKWTMRAPHEYVASTKQKEKTIQLTDSEVIFVGYGIQAKEYDWDDYKGMDVSGKTLLMLVGDPIHDPNLFRGHELTYYGRWTYKYEIAGAKHAAAVFVIHETERAGYDWDVVTHSFGHEDFVLQDQDATVRSLAEGWLARETAAKLFEQAGLNYEQCKQQALSKGFQPIKLPQTTCSTTIETTTQNVDSYNHIAILRGSDEAIIYMGHWDHFGVTEDGIISGAVDNASGCASVLATAKAFAHLTQPVPRSVAFFLPTLEEQNLLGSRYYVTHPLFKIEKTLAVLNYEMMNPWGRSATISSVCKGHTSLDDLLAEAASRQGKTVVADPEPAKGYMYRSDHLPFMQAGIPGLALFFSCMDHLDRRKAFIANDYHKPSDKPHSDWDLTGMAEDTKLLFDVGVKVATEGYRARWNPKSEFAR